MLTTRVWNYFHQLGTTRTIFKNFCEQQSAYTGYNVQITTDMHILFVGFMAITLGFQVFRKSEEYCPHEQRMYVNVSSPSLISCATYCDVDKTGCARLCCMTYRTCYKVYRTMDLFTYLLDNVYF